jgi:hypothetical protein
MKSIPRGRPILYKEVQGTSARGHFHLRVLNPYRKRSVPLAAPRHVDPHDHAWEKRPWSREPWRPCHGFPHVQERRPLHVIHPVCCGIDGHSAQLTACLRRVSDDGQGTTELVDCGTTSRALIAFRPWLPEQPWPVVAMESRGVSWKPVYPVFRETVEVCVANRQEVRQRPGKKTDERDATWIAVAHKILVSIYHLLLEETFDEEERYDRLLPRQEEREHQRALKALERLGYTVTLEQVAYAQALTIPLRYVVVSLRRIQQRGLPPRGVVCPKGGWDFVGNSKPLVTRTDPPAPPRATGTTPAFWGRFLSQ